MANIKISRTLTLYQTATIQEDLPDDPDEREIRLEEIAEAVDNGDYDEIDWDVTSEESDDGWADEET